MHRPSCALVEPPAYRQTVWTNVSSGDTLLKGSWEEVSIIARGAKSVGSSTIVRALEL